MGAVYRATDTKLHREVAIKILPEALANDPDYLARFTREAQVLAALNHPNIAAIYGVEKNALVMELVPGATVEEKIASGPIALEEALGLAAQIADALEAAHEKGVIHRDLKPANVKVTPEGVVKVLDFGLAKTADAESAASSANSPTLTMRATQLGIIMGTAGYMAPEQAAAKPVDRRADIWSFGVVLYELLAGKMLFTGETISDTLASVLKDPIHVEELKAPRLIRQLLARCLNRDPKQRLRDIGEARIAIREYLANPVAEEPRAAESGRGPGYRPWIACAVLLVALAAAVSWNFRPVPAPPVTRFSFALGANQTFTNLTRVALTMSPDGTQIVYVANGQLFRRTLSELAGHPIAGTENNASGLVITNPVFSPDGKWVAYLAGPNLRKIPPMGGAPVTLCSCATGASLGLSWTDPGILMTTYLKGIERISTSGGDPELLMPAINGEVLADARWLPGGEAIVFATANSQGGFGLNGRWLIGAYNVKTRARKTLVRDALGARYLPSGHLTYFVNGVLLGVPFDVRKLEVTGGATSLVEGIKLGTGIAQYATSNAGNLVYIPGPVTAAGQSLLARVNRQGDVEPLKVRPGVYGFPRVSKNGRYLAWEIDDNVESSIWVWESGGVSAPRRLTLPGTGHNRFPIWSPDGQRLAYQSDRAGDLGIWSQRVDGTGIAEHWTTPGKGLRDYPESWSPDGQTISFTEEKDQTQGLSLTQGGGGSSEVWTYSLREKQAIVFAAEPGGELCSSAFSPDGKWIAYQASLMAGSRIYVRSFPAAGAPFLAPQDGDTHHPVWSPDGKELLYIAGPGIAGSIAFSATPSVTFGSPARFPKTGFTTAAPASVRTFDVFPDGQHFIGVVAVGSSDEGAAQIQVFLNWFEDVKQRMAR